MLSALNKCYFFSYYYFYYYLNNKVNLSTSCPSYPQHQAWSLI